MSVRLSYINIIVWECEGDTVTTTDEFDEKLNLAEIETDIGYEVEEVIKARLLEVGLDCDEDGIHFTFNAS